MANDDVAPKRPAGADIRYSYSYSYSYTIDLRCREVNDHAIDRVTDDAASKGLAEDMARRARTDANLRRAFSDLVSELNRAYGQPAGDAADTSSQHVLALLAVARFLDRMGPDYLAPFADQFANLAQALNNLDNGSIPSAGREETEREHLERLLSIMNQEDDPELGAIDNQRLRYSRILWEMSAYFCAIGRDKLPGLGTYIGGLAAALKDPIDGVTDLLFVTKGSKRDPLRIWGARLQAALGLECLLLSGLSREAAANHAVRHYEALKGLMRGDRKLKSSLLSWYDRYVEGRVPVPELLEVFRTERRKLKAAKFSPAEYQRRGEQALAQAVKTASR